MKTLAALVLLGGFLLLAEHANGQDLKARLAEANSTEKIEKFYHRFSEFGTSHEQQFEADGVRFFTFWISTADQPQVFFWAYQLVGKKWVLLIDHSAQGKEAGAEYVWSFGRRAFILVRAGGQLIHEHRPKKG